jgi:hypothetical protein
MTTLKNIVALLPKTGARLKLIRLPSNLTSLRASQFQQQLMRKS